MRSLVSLKIFMLGASFVVLSCSDSGLIGLSGSQGGDSPRGGSGADAFSDLGSDGMGDLADDGGASGSDGSTNGGQRILVAGGEQQGKPGTGAVVSPDNGALNIPGVNAGNSTILNPDQLLSDSAKIGTVQFGLMVNDLSCGLCHVQIRGDVVSTRRVGGMWEGTLATVEGGWFAAEAFEPTSKDSNDPESNIHLGENVVINVSKGVEPFSNSPKLPNDLDMDGKPDFPKLNATEIEAGVKGYLRGPGRIVTEVYQGNLVLVGTPNSPIEIVGEVLVKGDLVLKGPYKGIGTIYATGNVYIPADLIAMDGAFPYPAGEQAAIDHAKQSILKKKDALAIATSKSIILSDFDDHLDLEKPEYSVFNHPRTPPDKTFGALGVLSIENWYTGGLNAYRALYEPSPINCDSGKVDHKRSISRVDAFLFAEKTIGGRANRNSVAINGGVMADSFHVISAAPNCAPGTHPVHGYDQTKNHIIYDLRLSHGLVLMSHLKKWFE